MTVFQSDPPPSRRKYTMTAIETRISTTITDIAVIELIQKNRLPTGSRPATANTIITMAARAEVMTTPGHRGSPDCP